jgi:hypothetical protein
MISYNEFSCAVNNEIIEDTEVVIVENVERREKVVEGSKSREGTMYYYVF